MIWRTFFIFLVALSTYIKSFAQNLVTNPSFEEVNDCPIGGNSSIGFPWESTIVTNWYRATRGTPDPMNSCANGNRRSNLGVPTNAFHNYLPAKSGNGYVGCHMIMNDNRDYREYIFTDLTEPLKSGHTYYLSFWVCLSTRYKGYVIDQIGAYLGSGFIPRYIEGPLDDLIPQVNNPAGNYLEDTSNWMQISGSFVAEGGEDQIIIGNFPTFQNQNPKMIATQNNNAYYLIDDICLFDLEGSTSKQDTIFCDEKFEIQLPARNDFTNHIWNTGDTGATISVSEAGTYWVSSNRDCGFATDTFIIHHKWIPDFSLGKDTIICDGSAIELQAPSTPNVAFLWQDSSKGNRYHVTESGVYSLKVFNESCSSTDSIAVIIDDFSQDLGEDLSFCARDQQSATLKANVPPGAQVIWSDGSMAETLVIKDEDTYWVTVRNHVCSGTDTMHLTLENCDCYFIVPTAFSPNNDALNDIFKPMIEPDCPISGYVLNLYNRYGQLLFRSTDPSSGWDGTYKGRPSDAGTYFYEVKFEAGVGRKKYQEKGDILLIR